MLKRGFYLWRLAWTAFAFAALGVGGFLLATAVIPAFTWFQRGERSRNRRAQAIIRQSLRLYIAMLRVLGVLKLEVIGAEKLSGCKGKLIIANHPTLIDVVLLMALVPDAKCVVKADLFRHPLLRPVVQAAGYLSNGCEPEALIENCRAALAAGDNLIIFPEGTRSSPGKPMRFHRGFAHIAVRSGAKLQPVTIACEPIMLVKGEPFYKIPDSPSRFRIELTDEIDPKRVLGYHCGPPAREARRLVSYVEADYRGRLNHG